MASAERQDGGAGAPGARPGGEDVPVILDGGASVKVAAIELAGEPRVGLRFQHEGVVWEITRAKDHTRGWVARPVHAAVRCASR